MTDYRDFYRELRTDWLKQRGCLFDSSTRLPALPSVLDEVRRRLEDGEAIGLIYLDPSGGGHLESSCGWQAYDRLICEVAEILRGYRLSDLDERDAVALAGVRSDEFMLFVGLGGNGGNAGGAGDRLTAVRAAVAERLEQALAACSDELHQVPRLQSAALQLRLEPKVRIERSIYQSLDQARAICRRESERRQSGRLTELRRMLAESDVRIRYQPIVQLENGRIHGFEALAAAPSAECFENPESLFAFAEESDAILDLERLCRSLATRQAVQLLRYDSLGAGGKLFINCSAHTFADPELIGHLERNALGAGLDPNDLVVEITERVAITEWRLFCQTLDGLRRSGLRVAIDDMGSGYSSLHAVGEIQPDYLKFDFSLIHNIHRSSIKRDLLETLVVLADKIGALSIAEGIETEEELDTVREMGVRYGQGYLFARPAAAEEVGPIHFPLEALG